MEQLLVQKALRGGQSLESLLEEHGLKVDRKHGLALLNYDMIDSQKSNPIVQECRSLTLEEGSWDVIAMAFPRFFNAWEGTAAPIDWETAVAYEKIDGSLLQLFPYKEQGRPAVAWYCTTRGKLDGAGSLPDSSKFDTFGDLFWHLMPKGDGHLNYEYCYTFELVSPWNRIVTVYEEPALYLLTARHVPTLKEISADEADEIAAKIGFRRPKRFKFNDLSEVQKFTEQIGITEEGFVVCDGNLNRIKVKNLSYLALADLFNNGQPRFWSITLTGEESEFLSYFPEYEKEIEIRRSWLSKFLEDLNEIWEKNKDTEDQKTFAMAVKDLPGSALLFNTRKKKLDSVMDVWSGMDLASKLKVCERYYGDAD